MVAKSFDVAKAHAGRKGSIEPIRNGYWLAHRLLDSRARVYYGDIYNIPDEIGQFDCASESRCPHHHPTGSKGQAPAAYFIPNARMNPDSTGTYDAWWVFSEGCFREMLQVLGFKIESITWKKHMCTGRNPACEEECLNIVARRAQ